MGIGGKRSGTPVIGRELEKKLEGLKEKRGGLSARRSRSGNDIHLGQGESEGGVDDECPDLSSELSD